MFENEEWEPIQEFPHYLVSNLGRVKRYDSVSARKISVNDKGFPIITIYAQDSKTRYLRQINKLVAIAFLPPPFDPRFDTAVWHIDGDLLNCKADNLRWDTRHRVVDWNEMHRRREPRLKTPRVKNNRTGIIYENAFECGMAEGETEEKIVWRVERQAMHMEDDRARYRYIFD